MVVAEAPEETGVAPVQDALCAIRLAVWALERATVREGVDMHRVIDTLVRRAEELRGLLASDADHADHVDHVNRDRHLGDVRFATAP